LYRKLNNREFEEFESMLIRMCDIRNPNYVTKELMKVYPEIFIILDDQSSQLTKEIIKYENEIRATATEFLLKASELLQNYKRNISSIGQLLELVKEYEDKCQSNVVKDKINKFIITVKGYYSIFSFNNLYTIDRDFIDMEFKLLC
jgi:transcriptional regulator of heat shock response